MIIEILNDAGEVIRKVYGASNPQVEVARAGGAAWRLYIPSDAERTDELRSVKIAETRREALRRIGIVIPALANESTLNLLVEMLQAGMVTAPTPSTDMDRVKEIYLYARQRIVQAQTATEDQLNAYDPATDPSWPA